MWLVPTVTASTMITRFCFGRKVRCHKGAVEIFYLAADAELAVRLFGGFAKDDDVRYVVGPRDPQGFAIRRPVERVDGA